MRIAVFSDVHGNLTALQTVLNHIFAQNDIDHIVFAGDLCLVGPRPRACIDLIRQHNITCLVGNTDQWILAPPPITDDMDESVQLKRMQLQAVCRWTTRKLDQDSLAWIKTLQGSFSKVFKPTSNPTDNLLIVHANPIDVNQIIFPPVDKQLELYGKVRQTDDDLELLLGKTKERLIAFGHLHIPSTRRWKNKVLVNISSVNLPGDGDPRAKYAVLTWQRSKGWSVQRHRLKYPLDSEISALTKNQPPGWEDQRSQIQKEGLYSQVV
jgi:predicted phosphodiesterase